MTEKLPVFQEYILEAQPICLEDIREGNLQAFTRKWKTPVNKSRRSYRYTD